MNIERITKDAGRNTHYALRNGSAIILAVVLTTLLAILGVLFLFSSRVDSVATSAVGDNHDLKLAVDTVVAQISEVLTNNVPRADANGIYYGTYYNYPDVNNFWLACLEPYYNSVTNDYRWRHITDLYNNFGLYGLSANDIIAGIVYDRNDTAATGVLADADGDGVSDSIWVQVNDVNSSKGKPIYAAIRIIDNGGMLNVNTGYIFDPCNSVGSTQLDINLMALASRDNTHTATGEKESRLLSYRCGTADANFYGQNVIWQYGLPNGNYTPFDISDELVLRYRYILNNDQMTTRIENLWTYAFKGGLEYPRTNTTTFQTDPNYWFARVNNVSADPCVYDYQHLATTYNMDRIIAPDGSKMFNVNSASLSNILTLRNAISAVLDPNLYDADQIAVNLVDYIDTNSEVTYFVDPCTLKSYFGFATPCIYISQIAENFYQPPSVHGIPPPPVHSYAIELYKPYLADVAPNGWDVNITDDNGTTTTIPISGWTATNQFHVLANIDSANANISVAISAPDRQDDNSVNFGLGTAKAYITLWRDVNGYGPMIVDSFIVPAAGGGWMDTSGIAHSFERDIATNRCIKRIQNSNMTTSPTLGYMNDYNSGSDMIQAHPANKQFKNIGEIGQLFRTDAYLTGPNDTEVSVRLNIADPCVQNLFKYLTVMDPAPGDPNQTRIKGRININTAPWYVLAQLPWVSYQNYNLAQAIVSNRDTYGAFKSTGELMQVIDANNDTASIGYYASQPFASVPTVLMTPTDTSPNDDVFEKRDVIFDRISNLVTVRSDVFTAYILVRIGSNGPQKRVIAIFDRSGVTPAGGKVKVVAIQSVPDPR